MQIPRGGGGFRSGINKWCVFGIGWVLLCVSLQMRGPGFAPGTLRFPVGAWIVLLTLDGLAADASFGSAQHMPAAYLPMPLVAVLTIAGLAASAAALLCRSGPPAIWPRMLPLGALSPWYYLTVIRFSPGFLLFCASATLICVGSWLVLWGRSPARSVEKLWPRVKRWLREL